MNVNACININVNVNAAGSDGLSSEQPVSQRVSAAVLRTSDKGSKSFRDYVAEKALFSGINVLGTAQLPVEETKETTLSDIVAETVGSTAYLSNLFFFRPLTSVSTASGSGVRLDTEVNISGSLQAAFSAMDAPEVIFDDSGMSSSDKPLTEIQNKDILKSRNDEAPAELPILSPPSANNTEDSMIQTSNMASKTSNEGQHEITEAGLNDWKPALSANDIKVINEVRTYIKQTETGEEPFESPDEIITLKQDEPARAAGQVLYSQEEQAASTNGLYQAKEQPLSGRDNTKAPDKALNNQASFDSIVNGADVGRSSNSKQDLNWQGREKQGLVDLDIQDRETERSAGSDKNNVNQFANLPSMVTTYEYNEATEKSIAVERAFTGFDIDLRSVRAESHEIRLVLEPENLGEIAITVVKKEDGISAKIRSEDREVCAAVSNHLQKLVNSIENKGITLNSVDIILGQAEGGMTFSQGFSSSGQEQQRGNTYQQPFKIEPSESSSFFSQWQATADPGTDKAAEDAVHTREYRV